MFRSLALALALLCATAYGATSGTLFVTTNGLIACDSGGNLTLAPDTCVSAPPPPPSDDSAFDPKAFHEFSIAKFAVCDNGTSASLALFKDTKCQTRQALYQASETLESGMSYEGLCLGLLQFGSVAFLCAGSDSVNAGPTTSPTHVNTVVAPTTLAYSGTPIASSKTVTTTTVVPSAPPPPLSTAGGAMTSSVAASTSTIITGVPSAGLPLVGNSSTLATPTPPTLSSSSVPSAPPVSTGGAALWRASIGWGALAGFAAIVA